MSINLQMTYLVQVTRYSKYLNYQVMFGPVLAIHCCYYYLLVLVREVEQLRCLQLFIDFVNHFLGHFHGFAHSNFTIKLTIMTMVANFIVILFVSRSLQPHRGHHLLILAHLPSSIAILSFDYFTKSLH